MSEWQNWVAGCLFCATFAIPSVIIPAVKTMVGVKRSSFFSDLPEELGTERRELPDADPLASRASESKIAPAISFWNGLRALIQTVHRTQ